MGSEALAYPEALHALLTRYGPGLRRWLATRVRPASDVDDVVQDVFMRALRRSRQERIENVEGYLFQIAANLVIERSRRSARRDAAPAWNGDRPELDDAQSPERILLGKEAYDRFAEALRELPERTRTVFILNRFEDMTGAQIAERLEISVSTVEKQMTRALAHLRARLR